MNKTELIEEIAGRTDSSKAEAQRYVDTLEKVVTEVLKSGEESRSQVLVSSTYASRRPGRASTPRQRKR